jgi:hypothetical protein
MKQFILIFFWLSFGLQVGLANMASPVREGSMFGSPFISRHVTIISEQIRVIPQSDFLTARFEIQYVLEVDSIGTQIPLLFYAIDYEEAFQISLDGEALVWQPVPSEYSKVSDTPFDEFSETFSSGAYDSTEETVTIYWNEYGGGTVVRPRDLFFFETDLLPGRHLVTVSYLANHWQDRSDWVNQYSFRYSLSPATYWKSLGQLTIEVDATQNHIPLTTNLGVPAMGRMDSIARWEFDTIPVPEFWVQYVPEISPRAHFLIRLGPWGITGIGAAMAILLHFVLQIRYRRKHRSKRVNPWIWMGGFLVPLLTFFLYINSFEIIDAAIGIEASRYHGYYQLAGVIFWVLMAPYMLIAWAVDRVGKRQ